MCLALPGKIISVDEPTIGLKMARVDFGGIIKSICIQWVDANVGDFILVHAGVAIACVDTVQAQEALEDLERLAKANDNLYL